MLESMPAADAAHADADDLAGRNTVEAVGITRFVRPIDGWDNAQPLALPPAAQPTAAIGIPLIHDRRPLRVEAEGRCHHRPVAAQVDQCGVGLVPGGLEAVIVEVEVATVVDTLGAVGLEAEAVREGREVLRHQVGDADGRGAGEHLASAGGVLAAWLTCPARRLGEGARHGRLTAWAWRRYRGRRQSFSLIGSWSDSLGCQHHPKTQR